VLLGVAAAALMLRHQAGELALQVLVMVPALALAVPGVAAAATAARAVPVLLLGLAGVATAPLAAGGMALVAGQAEVAVGQAVEEAHAQQVRRGRHSSRGADGSWLHAALVEWRGFVLMIGYAAGSACYMQCW
jgi:hypothetical protein